jgi:hypothetical protein
MLKKNLLMLSVSVMFGAALVAPSAALAQFGPPPGPPHFSRLDGAAGPHGLDRGGQANFRGVEGRIAASSANSYTRNSYAGHGYGRGYRYWPYAAAAYAYGGSYASSEEDCYYVSAYRRNGYSRRVLRCGGN